MGESKVQFLARAPTIWMVHEMHESIKRALDKFEEEAAKIARMRKLLERFPDIELIYSRWSNFLGYATTQVNPIADQVDIYHSCSCCPDPVLKAQIYIEVDGDKVFTSPSDFSVGEKDEYVDVPYDGWRNKLKDAGISDAAIEKVAEHFREEAKELRSRADDSWHLIERLENA